jgi:hypothetical protein
MRWLGSVAVGVVLWCVTSADASADKRVALVIGNGVYTKAPRLLNPSHDARDVAAALKRIDFDVIQGTDLDRAQMQDAIVRFARAAQAADVGLFYYSGHAIQFKGVNYLMPVDAKLDDEADLYRFTKIDDVFGYLQEAKTLKILVLDSCRDNPLAEMLKRSIGLTRAASLPRGLARMEAPIGTIISYATQAGQTAVDGKGRNSPYTTAFLKHIEEPSEIGDIFRDITAEVYRATGQTQLPELSLSITDKFYLKGPVSATTNLPSQPTPVERWVVAPPLPPTRPLRAPPRPQEVAPAGGQVSATVDLPPQPTSADPSVVPPPLPRARPPHAAEVLAAVNAPRHVRNSPMRANRHRPLFPLELISAPRPRQSTRLPRGHSTPP